MKKIVIHTDGGCHGNPGPGGWATTLEYSGHKRELSGGVPATTNNRMELQAAIEGLAALKEPCQIDFYTDSEYVKNGITQWLAHWKRSGWKTKLKKPVRNEDLWRILDLLVGKHRIEWYWLKGHAGHAGNERCDKLANEEISRIKKNFGPAALNEALAEFTASPNPNQPLRAQLVQKESRYPFTSRPDTLI
jgi:ribonuclease HI